MKQLVLLSFLLAVADIFGAASLQRNSQFNMPSGEITFGQKFVDFVQNAIEVVDVDITTLQVGAIVNPVLITLKPSTITPDFNSQTANISQALPVSESINKAYGITDYSEDVKDMVRSYPMSNPVVFEKTHKKKPLALNMMYAVAQPYNFQDRSNFTAYFDSMPKYHSGFTQRAYWFFMLQQVWYNIFQEAQEHAIKSIATPLLGISGTMLAQVPDDQKAQLEKDIVEKTVFSILDYYVSELWSCIDEKKMFDFKKLVQKVYICITPSDDRSQTKITSYAIDAFKQEFNKRHSAFDCIVSINPFVWDSHKLPYQDLDLLVAMIINHEAREEFVLPIITDLNYLEEKLSEIA